MPRSASESQRANSTASPRPRKVRTTCVPAVDDALRAKLMVRAVSGRRDIGRIVTALLRDRLPSRVEPGSALAASGACLAFALAVLAAARKPDESSRRG